MTMLNGSEERNISLFVFDSIIKFNVLDEILDNEGVSFGTCKMERNFALGLLEVIE